MADLNSYTVILKNLSSAPSDFSCSGALARITSKQTEFSPIALKCPQNSHFLLLVASNSDFLTLDIKTPFQKNIFSSSFTASNGVCALLALAQGEKLTPCMFGKSGSCELKIGDLLNLYAQNYQKNTIDNAQEKRRENEQAKELLQKASEGDNEYTKLEQSTPENFLPEYDDEQIAQTDYFAYNDEIAQAKEIIDEQLSYQANGANDHRQANQPQKENANPVRQNENESCPARMQKEGKFYSDIKDDLDELFEKYPPISSLSKVIPNSKWVKINYGSNSFYAVGIIYENNFVKYLVYAVPGKRDLAPKGFESYSYFIPESIFDLSGNGFWCTFQSAEDGKRILKP